MKTVILKVRKVKRIETDGKADTHSILLEGSAAPGVDFSLTIASEYQEEIKKIVSTVPGSNIEMTLAPALYGNIESYGQPQADMDPAEAREIIEALQAIPDPYAGTDNAGKDHRGATQAEALEARRAAWKASQEQEEAPDL